MDVEAVTDYSLEAQLWREHQMELTRYAAALVGPSDSTDVVSDAIVSLLQSGKLTEADNPVALMYRAILAKAQSHHRTRFSRRKREQRFADAVHKQDPELHPDVIAAVVRLSPRQRACVYLAYWEDLTQEQVGIRMGISVGSVKRHLDRARSRLRRVLDE